MRPWFTFVVICLIAVSLLVFLFIVDFVLINRTMFEQSFNIQIRFFAWSHTWAEIQFMYIIAASILLGAVVIAITTLGLDTQRALKLRNLKKELKRLQQSLQEAQANVSKVSPAPEEPKVVTQTIEASPEEINRSFEDVVQKDDFLERAKQRQEEDMQADHGEHEFSPKEQPQADFSGSPAERQKETFPLESASVGVEESGPEPLETTTAIQDDSFSQPIEPAQAVENVIVTETPEYVQKTKENEPET